MRIYQYLSYVVKILVNPPLLTSHLRVIAAASLAEKGADGKAIATMQLFVTLLAFLLSASHLSLLAVDCNVLNYCLFEKGNSPDDSKLAE